MHRSTDNLEADELAPRSSTGRNRRRRHLEEAQLLSSRVAVQKRIGLSQQWVSPGAALAPISAMLITNSWTQRGVALVGALLFWSLVHSLAFRAIRKSDLPPLRHIARANRFALLTLPILNVLLGFVPFLLVPVGDSQNQAIGLAILGFSGFASAAATAGERRWVYPACTLSFLPILIWSAANGTWSIFTVTCLVMLVVAAFTETLHKMMWSIATSATENDLLLEELESTNERLLQQATHDALTGLANRAAFDEELARRCAADERLAVAFVDIDHFKGVNDTYGHEIGDGVLRVVADRLLAFGKPGDLVARRSGDEFTLVRTVGDETTEELFAELVHRCLSGPAVIGGRELSITCSVGVAMRHYHDEQPDDVLRFADHALYEAKRRGRNRAVGASAGLRGRSIRDEVTAEGLRQAISSGQIQAWFQPIVDLRTGAWIGAEALARWVLPDGTVRRPSHFLPAARRLGLLRSVCQSVQMHAIETRSTLVGTVDPTFRMRLNIAADAFGDCLDERFLDLLERFDCDPSYVAMEITDINLLGDGAVAIARRLRAAGINLELDDVGLGSLPIELLAELGLHGFTLDRSLVYNLQGSTVRPAVGAIADIGRRFGITVCAEGIETEGQAQAMLDLGITVGQGFRYSPALARDAFLLGCAERSLLDAVGGR